MSIYYSTQSFLAYCINHYFYDGIHYTCAAAEFHPHRSPNPRSSNPLWLYTHYYEVWKDRDNLDNHIAQHRLNLRKGVIACHSQGCITGYRATQLKRICKDIDIIFFYPIVYRIDASRIDASRINQTSGSAATGSDEILIADLSEAEFDILFLDFSGDNNFNDLKHGAVGDSRFASPILEGRC